MGRSGHGCGHNNRTDKHVHTDLASDVTASDVRETRSILTYLTRLLFVSIVLSCIAVFVVSILILAHCRHTVEPIEDLTGSSDGQCTSLGIPAYFACVILVIAVFGFGCVGRKVTGGMLVVVSALAMVVAVVVVLKQECGSDESSRHLTFSVYSILEGCGRGGHTDVYDSPEYESWLRARGRLGHKPDVLDCTQALQNLGKLCPRFSSTVRDYNETGADSCVQHVRDTLYSLCLKDGEITVPILITLPIFYIGIGVGLVYVKHVDSSSSSDGGDGSSKSHTVSTNTDTDASTTTTAKRRGPVGPKLFHECLSWLCFRNSLCFHCMVKGNGSRSGSPCGCLPTSRRRTPMPSRLSFQLKELSRDDEEAAQGILRTDSPPEHHDDVRVTDEQAKRSLFKTVSFEIHPSVDCFGFAPFHFSGLKNGP
nr:hypothetical protein BaRGS_000559 [Batillaria attramentaria]